MKFRDFFGSSSSEKGVQNLQTRAMDAFADNVIFELKTLISSAITQALEERESRYMRSILEESFFTLETLVIKAMDAQTSQELESFLSNHESINPQFRTQFFEQVMQREYRSSRGASVRVSPGLTPIIEVNPLSLDTATEDETFILSLKGRRIRFEARAVLNGPIRKTPLVTASTASAPRGTAMGQVFGETPKNMGARIHIRWQDQNGSGEKWVHLPALLGREATASLGRAAGSSMDIRGTYVSRQQLIIFEALGHIYCFVPEEASLTCSNEQGEVLRPNTLHRLDPSTPLRLLTGVPVNSLTAPSQRDNRADDPLIEVGTGQQATPHADATPRPKAVR
jgi:hypothetical protein